jgi:DNA-binding XRE family transcriptional regulator
MDVPDGIDPMPARIATTLPPATVIAEPSAERRGRPSNGDGRMRARPEGCGKALGPVLRAVREERGKTREWLAVDAGLAVGTLARIELDRSDPGWKTITAIVDALGLTLADLARLMDDDAQDASSAS